MVKHKMIKHKTTRAGSPKAERGFSLIEVMVAIVVMSVGLLAVIASFAAAVSATQSAEEDLIARQKALEAMESIYTARNSTQIPFSSINNVASGGIFLSGANPLLCAGPDGLVGTADDVPCTTAAGTVCPDGGAECMVLPGPDGVLGTADDVTMSLGNFTRTITLTPVPYPAGAPQAGTTNPNMMAIAITISYTKAGLPARSYTANGLITSFH
jgi:prepilin-type N-terminal cleavage/methylation domain-containing protein